MALQDIEPVTGTPLGELDGAAEFEAGLIKLMPFLRVFARSLSRQRELAEDLAQETLAKAWRSRRSFNPGSNLKAWLFTILRNEFYSHQRRAWRQVPLDPALPESAHSMPAEQPWALELSDTASAMHRLPNAQREALILVGACGFSYKDAAAISRSAIGTVKSRVGRARQALREIADSPAALPVQTRRANGAAMTQILAQLSHVGRTDAPRESMSARSGKARVSC